MRLVLAFTVILRVAAAQALPDGQALWAGADAKWKSFHSVHFDTEITMETTFPGAARPMTVTSQMSAAYVLPGHTRLESKTPGMTLLNVSDGETTWIYNSMKKEYMRLAAGEGLASVMTAMGVKIPEPSITHPGYKTTGEQTIEIDGVKHDCWTVEMRIGDMVLGGSDGPDAAKMTGTVATLWIDKKLGLDMQSELDMKIHAGGKDIEMHQRAVKKDLKIDEPLPESLFAFTPPEGAKEVREMTLADGGAAGKPALAGKTAPAFEVKSLDGKAFSLASLKGKTVLLDFWATWCVPCAKSAPALEKISREFKNRGLVILGVNTGEDREIVEKFLKKSPLEYPVLLSGNSGILESYEVTAYPTFVLIGDDGKMIANDIGFNGEDQLRELIAKAGLAAK